MENVNPAKPPREVLNERFEKLYRNSYLSLDDKRLITEIKANAQVKGVVQNRQVYYLLYLMQDIVNRIHDQCFIDLKDGYDEACQAIDALEEVIHIALMLS